MNRKMQVAGMMTPNVIVANIGTKFDQIVDFFNSHNIQHLPVTDGDRLVGILSINDITKYLLGKLKTGIAFNLASLMASFDVREVMTKDPVSVKPDDDFSSVVKLLAGGKFQSVPVVKDGLIVGIITNKDVVRAYQNGI